MVCLLWKVEGCIFFSLFTKQDREKTAGAKQVEHDYEVVSTLLPTNSKNLVSQGAQLSGMY